MNHIPGLTPVGRPIDPLRIGGGQQHAFIGLDHSANIGGPETPDPLYPGLAAVRRLEHTVSKQACKDVAVRLLSQREYTPSR